MLLANQYAAIAATVFVIAFLVGLGVIVLYLFRGYERLAQRALSKRYEGLSVRHDPQPGDVIINYCTYHGVVAWVTQTTHRIALPPTDARILLRRLLQFNLTWSLLSPGSVLIVPLAIWNYLAEQGSISRQESALDVTNQEPVSPLASRAEFEMLSNPYAPPQTMVSLPRNRGGFRRLLGWVCALLAVLFAISLIGQIALGEATVELLIGGLVFVGLFGWIAWDWIGRSPES